MSLVPIALCALDNEDEPRVRDMDLGERLGFSRPRDIRKLIKDNLSELARYGEMRAMASRPPQINGLCQGKDATEYWLNEMQAVLICIKSATERAADVREAVIRAFVNWRRGPSDLRDSLARLIAEVAELRTIRDERIACQTGVTIYEIADSYGIQRKGRGRLIPKMRRHLMRWCELRGIEWRKSPMHIFRPFEEVFPQSCISLWWKEYSSKNARDNRQALLPFPAKVK